MANFSSALTGKPECHEKLGCMSAEKLRECIQKAGLELSYTTSAEIEAMMQQLMRMKMRENRC